MTWITLSLVSALFLGWYDICKKQSVQENAVIPVLFISVCVNSVLWLGPTLLSASGVLETGLLHVPPLDLTAHVRLFLKSALVGSSWILAYFALKNLPVSIVSPIRATSPLWTLAGAVILLGERPSPGQWVGIVITLLAFFGLSLASLKDGVGFHRNRWVWAILAATLLGAASALYDRYLLGSHGYSVASVQAWFSHYLVIVLAPLMLGWKQRWWPRGRFQWRWSIPMIGLTLLVGDYLYFMAMADPDALVAVISSLRRTAVVIPFIAGFLLFKERHFRWKAPCVAAMLVGVGFILLG